MEKQQLKEVLKLLNVLYIVKQENSCKQTLNTLNVFFNHVHEANSLNAAIEIYNKSRPAVIISDIDMPELQGFSFIREIRRSNKKIPIIILSHLKDEKYLFEAIPLKLIDYLLYPVNISKLIQAVNQTALEIVHNGQTRVQFKNNSWYNYFTKEVANQNNKVYKLTKNEFRFLEFLITNQGKVISKEQIEEYLWGDEIITQSAFKSLFSRLRQKIGKEVISNVFGVGYKIEIK